MCNVTGCMLVHAGAWTRPVTPRSRTETRFWIHEGYLVSWLLAQLALLARLSTVFSTGEWTETTTMFGLGDSKRKVLKRMIIMELRVVFIPDRRTDPGGDPGHQTAPTENRTHTGAHSGQAVASEENHREPSVCCPSILTYSHFWPCLRQRINRSPYRGQARLKAVCTSS